jgi:hypothetical protein
VLLFAAHGAIAEEEMVVITNLENANVIDRAYVIKVYRAQSRDGRMALPSSSSTMARTASCARSSMPK